MPIPPIERQPDVAQMRPDRAEANAFLFGNLEHRATFVLDDRLAELQIAQELSDLARAAGDNPSDQPDTMETSTRPSRQRTINWRSAAMWLSSAVC